MFATHLQSSDSRFCFGSQAPSFVRRDSHPWTLWKINKVHFHGLYNHLINFMPYFLLLWWAWDWDESQCSLLISSSAWLSMACHSSRIRLPFNYHWSRRDWLLVEQLVHITIEQNIYSKLCFNQFCVPSYQKLSIKRTFWINTLYEYWLR